MCIQSSVSAIASVMHRRIWEAGRIASSRSLLPISTLTPPGTCGTLVLPRPATTTTLCRKPYQKGSRMVRELFVMAREAAPSIIFMDEIDSIGSSRVEGSEGGDSEVQRTMLELLNQLDGFEPTQNIKVGVCQI